jgi:hypothetical protein
MMMDGLAERRLKVDSEIAARSQPVTGTWISL